MQRLSYLLSLLFVLFILPVSTKAGAFNKFSLSSLEIDTSAKSYLVQPVYYKHHVLYATGPTEKEDSLHIKHMRRKARWSKFLGLGSIGGFLIALACIPVLPLAITLAGASMASSIGAIVTGSQVKNHTNDPKALADARFGIIAGTVGLITIVGTIAFIVLVVTVVIRFFTNFLSAFLGGFR